MSLKYNQQDATFTRSIYFYKLLYIFQAVPPPITRSTKLYIQRQVLSNQYCCLLLSWMRWNSMRWRPILLSSGLRHHDGTATVYRIEVSIKIPPPPKKKKTLVLTLQTTLRHDTKTLRTTKNTEYRFLWGGNFHIFTPHSVIP